MIRVVIVGAGVIGLSCAVRLAKTGARVTVLEGEKEDWAAHGPAASLAAAGMLAPVSEATLERDAHSQLAALSLASFDLWRSEHKGAIWEDCVRFDGATLIAKDDAGAEALIAAARALGRSGERLSAGQWRKRTHFSAKVETGVFIADEGVADPGRTLSALAMDARRYGVRILFGHDVEAVETEALRVRCFNGAAFEADRVVLAPGAWANDAMMAAAPSLQRIKPAKGTIAPVTLAQPLGATVRAGDFYLVARAPGDAVVGATMEWGKFDRRADKAHAAALIAAAQRVLGDEVSPRPDAFAWAGVRPMSPDSAPMAGPDGAEGVLVAAGHSRNGWLLAPITAEIICAYVYGDDIAPLWAAFAPKRFEKT